MLTWTPQVQVGYSPMTGESIVRAKNWSADRRLIQLMAGTKSSRRYQEADIHWKCRSERRLTGHCRRKSNLNGASCIACNAVCQALMTLHPAPLRFPQKSS